MGKRISEIAGEAQHWRGSWKHKHCMLISLHLRLDMCNDDGSENALVVRHLPASTSTASQMLSTRKSRIEYTNHSRVTGVIIVLGDNLQAGCSRERMAWLTTMSRNRKTMEHSSSGYN